MNAQDFTALCVVAWSVACTTMAVSQPLTSLDGVMALKRLIPRILSAVIDPRCPGCWGPVERPDPDALAFRCPACGIDFDTADLRERSD